MHTIQTLRDEGGSIRLMWCWVPADLDTPMGVYLKLTNAQTNSFLFESIEGGETLGRYSVIGCDPDLIWECHKTQVRLYKDTTWHDDPLSPLESLREQIKACQMPDLPADLPPIAAGGLFGMMGYGMVRLIEAIPDTNPDPLGLPDARLIRPCVLAIFDSVVQQICLVAYGTKAKERLDKALTDLAKSVPPRTYASALAAPLPITEGMGETGYKAAVLKAKDHIIAGDIFQVVLSRRFSIPFDLPSLELYRILRRLNPSPFMFHIVFEDGALVGSSPEILVRLRGGIVTIRPLAGTRPRGNTPQEDKDFESELLANRKERAEHLMLLDLGRNDVGRVAEIGSMAVPAQFVVERYSHVMHISSTVTGTLHQKFDAVDALFAGFPAGTVSGAPKIRAMEIIEDLEPVARSFYAGCIGYFDGMGDMDTCITLRTAFIKDGTLYVQAGAGIVADSDPQAEYRETVKKAHVIVRAAEIAVGA